MRAGLSAVVHPSGWLALMLDTASYHRLGLTGHRVSGPKCNRSSTGARRGRRGDEYAVLAKLKGLYNRPKHHRRVAEAAARLAAPLEWRMVFLESGVPQVRPSPKLHRCMSLSTCARLFVCESPNVSHAALVTAFLHEARQLNLAQGSLHVCCGPNIPTTLLSADSPAPVVPGTQRHQHHPQAPTACAGGPVG